MHGFDLITNEASIRVSDKAILICPHSLKKYDNYNAPLNIYYKDGIRYTDDAGLVRIVRGYEYYPQMSFLEFGGAYYSNGNMLKFWTE